MFSLEDERWLKKVFAECFPGADEQIYKDRLKGFSMIVKNIIENMQRQLNQASRIWEKEPDSREVKKAFDLLKKNLFCLKKFCAEKIKPAEEEEGGADE